MPKLGTGNIVRQSIFKLPLVALGLLAAAACGNGGDDAADTGNGQDAAKVAQLQERIADLKARKTRIEDIKAIEKLQRAYGYYVDYGLWDQVVDLFADDATIEFGLDGVYKGKDRIKEYFYTLTDGQPGLKHGQLNQNMLIMPVVTVADDGQTAKARWTDIIMAGELGKWANWGLGPFENEYVKEDGVWKISKLHWYEILMVPYDKGWAKSPSVTGAKYISDKLPPDAPPTENYEPWPATYLPAFSFKNPVTGE